MEIYHVFNKSIAGFKIFNNDDDFSRIKGVISYYTQNKPSISFSNFIKFPENGKYKDLINLQNENLVEIIAYCVMPTHVHFILKEVEPKGISRYMSNILNSYTRYFNLKYKRKGPLWQGRTKRVLVETDEQLLHLTRYIHLNPVTAYIVDNPKQWSNSSYSEYITSSKNNDNVCTYEDLLDIKPNSYRNFVEDAIDYQRSLTRIKHLLFE